MRAWFVQNNHALRSQLTDKINALDAAHKELIQAERELNVVREDCEHKKVSVLDNTAESVELWAIKPLSVTFLFQQVISNLEASLQQASDIDSGLTTNNTVTSSPVQSQHPPGVKAPSSNLLELVSVSNPNALHSSRRDSSSFVFASAQVCPTRSLSRRASTTGNGRHELCASKVQLSSHHSRLTRDSLYREQKTRRYDHSLQQQKLKRSVHILRHVHQVFDVSLRIFIAVGQAS